MSLFTGPIRLVVCSVRLCQTWTSPSHLIVRPIVPSLTLAPVRSLCLAFSHTHTRRRTLFEVERCFAWIDYNSHSFTVSLCPPLCPVPFPVAQLNTSPSLSTDPPPHPSLYPRFNLLPTRVKLIRAVDRISVHAPVLRRWYARLALPIGVEFPVELQEAKSLMLPLLSMCWWRSAAMWRCGRFCPAVRWKMFSLQM